MPPTISPDDIIPPQEAEDIITARAGYALTYIKRKSFDRLSEKYFHPDKGVHFYPKGMKSTGLRLDNTFLANAVSKDSILSWGGLGGESIQLSFQDFYSNYIFDQDFSENAEVHFNEITLPGESGLNTNEIFASYPKSIFVEYAKGGESLILVFVKVTDKGWHLTALIHNQ